MDNEQNKTEKTLEKMVQNTWIKGVAFPTIGVLVVSAIYTGLKKHIAKSPADKQGLYNRILDDTVYGTGAIILAETTRDYKK